VLTGDCNVYESDKRQLFVADLSGYFFAQNAPLKTAKHTRLPFVMTLKGVNDDGNLFVFGY